jgi:hypothetical protein
VALRDIARRMLCFCDVCMHHCNSESQGLVNKFIHLSLIYMCVQWINLHHVQIITEHPL